MQNEICVKQTKWCNSYGISTASIWLVCLNIYLFVENCYRKTLCPISNFLSPIYEFTLWMIKHEFHSPLLHSPSSLFLLSFFSQSYFHLKFLFTTDKMVNESFDSCCLGCYLWCCLCCCKCLMHRESLHYAIVERARSRRYNSKPNGCHRYQCSFPLNYLRCLLDLFERSLAYQRIE